VVYVTDGATKRIWHRDLWLPTLKPSGKPWQAVKLGGVSLAAPTDVAALADGRLLVADGGALLMLQPEGDAHRLVWRWDRWGEGADERFGPRLRFALDGASLLVADTARHRVVWADWQSRRVLGQFGETDASGSDASHVAEPSFVSLRGTRAVVADAGNQRVLKLELRP